MNSPPLRIAVVYVIFGAVWIIFSDAVLHALVQDADLTNRLQTVKGWSFVAVTAVLVYWLSGRIARELKEK